MADALVKGDRAALARCITLAESHRSDHMKQAEILADYVAQNKVSAKGYQGTPYSLRLGVAGPPGAGKSTFIENIGMKLVASDSGKSKSDDAASVGNKVAVIPVDPSSHISGGSILGDMTRMENLSKSDRSYVRATPTRGVLGGVAEHTSEVISLCESGKLLSRGARMGLLRYSIVYVYLYI
jgi:LAO/AO transport system kinase